MLAITGGVLKYAVNMLRYFMLPVNEPLEIGHILYLVLVSTEQFSEQRSRTIRGPNRLGQHSSLMQVFLQNSATRSAVRTISTVAL